MTPTKYAAAARGEWQPIETAPKDGTEILVAGIRSIGKKAGTWMRAVAKFDKLEGAWVACGAPVRVTEVRAMITKPMLWQYCPEPPADGLPA